MAINQVKNPGLPANANITAGDLGKTERAEFKQGANSYAKVANTPVSSEAANVSISPKAREMSQAKRLVDDTPDIREDKVAHFKNLIAKGEYKAEASKIADGILNEAIKDELSKTPEIALAD